MKNYNYYEYQDINGKEITIFSGDIYLIKNILCLVSSINENSINFAQLSANSMEDFKNGNHDVIKYFDIQKLDFILSPEEIISNYIN